MAGGTGLSVTFDWHLIRALTFLCRLMLPGRLARSQTVALMQAATSPTTAKAQCVQFA